MLQKKNEEQMNKFEFSGYLADLFIFMQSNQRIKANPKDLLAEKNNNKKNQPPTHFLLCLETERNN